MANVQDPLVGLTAINLLAAETKLELKDSKEKSAYAMGLNIGKAWKRQTIELDPDVVVKGIKDGLADKGQLTDAEIREVLNKLQTETRTRQEARRKEEGVKNKAEGDAFLAANEEPGRHRFRPLAGAGLRRRGRAESRIG